MNYNQDSLRLSENSLNSLTNHYPVSIILFKVKK